MKKKEKNPMKLERPCADDEKKKSRERERENKMVRRVVRTRGRIKVWDCFWRVNGLTQRIVSRPAYASFVGNESLEFFFFFVQPFCLFGMAFCFLPRVFAASVGRDPFNSLDALCCFSADFVGDNNGGVRLWNWVIYIKT